MADAPTESAGPAAPAATEPPPPRAGRPRAKALALVAVAGLAAGALALGGATLLDEPVGQSAADPSQPIVVGPIVAPGQELTGGPEELPPISLILDRPVEAAVARLTPAQQVEVLAERARARGTAAAWVQAGAAAQRLGDQALAADHYRRALAIAPDDLAARAGLLIARAAAEPDGLDRAAAGLARLARGAPRSQLLAFNEGWVDVYRRDGRGAIAAWRRTITLGPNTALGRTARNLLVTIARQEGNTRP
ncbi:MAG: hypothetical protein MUE51_05905 [Thermoleophilia bacterium]|nr:hypothetical protein [Thermoleophilia bacterium]